MADQKYSDKCSTAWLPITTVASHSNHISTQPGRLVPGRGPLYDHSSPSEERVIQRHHSRRALSYGPGAPPVYSGEGGSHVGRMYYQSAPSSHALPNDAIRQMPPYAVREPDTDRESRASVESSGSSSEGVAHVEQKALHPTSQQQQPYHGTPHQSLQIAGICTTPGKCQGGGELSLTRLSQSGIKHDVPDGFILVGTKSPMLPGMTLVAAVDKRYLPDENTGMAMLGFGGNCIGCGAKGFRYFTEFSTHINLRLATQPKKQKHIKYYVITDSDGVLHKGQVIPWRGTEGKKRVYPVDSPFSPFSHGLKPDIPSDQSLASAASGPPQALSNPRYPISDVKQMPPPSFERGATQHHAQSPQYAYNSASYSPQMPYIAPPKKKSRWESGPTEGGVTVVNSDDDDPQSPGQSGEGGELPSKPWLAAACGVCPVLLLCQHSIPNIPCSIEDIIISDLLVGCFDPPLVSDQDQAAGAHPSNLHTPADSPSRGQPSKNSAGGNPSLLTTPMAILLTIQYFSQLVEDDRLSREDIESLLQDAQLELSASFQQPSLAAHSNILTQVQLPTLANLAATPSKGRVKVVASPISLDNAIMRAFKFVHEIHKHNNYKFPKVPIPEFIFILSISQQKAPEFCMLVTSLSQAKYLHEAMIGHPVGARITDNIAKLEQLFRLSSDALEQMVSNFEEVMGYGQLVYIPFNGFPRMKVVAEEAVKLEPKVHGAGKQYWKQSQSAIYAAQNIMAKQLLTQICTIAENSSILDLNLYTKVDVAIIVPCVTTLFNQTARRLAESGLLLDLALESESSAAQVETAKKYIIQHDAEDCVEKLKAFLDKIEKQSSTLFVLIFDQAQFYSSPRGVLDLPFYRNIMEASNTIPLFVTATPYLFQTNCSFIDPDNEVYWTETRTSAEFVTEAEEDDSFVEEPDNMYFGMKEYCDSIKWTHQFPLIRQDDAFERMALRTSRTAEDVDVSVLRCYLLIRHYAASIMWTAGIKPAEPHCSLKTLQIMREIMESPVRNADGSGTMLVIRIPSSELATLAYETLKNTRDRLGFQYRFAIVHDSGRGEFEVEEYFLMRLRMWRTHRGLPPGPSSDEWVPESYQDLLDLPCIVLLSGRERTGETFPRSLKYIDLRLIDRGFLYRSSLELEFSAIACYIGTGSGATNAGVRSAGSDNNQGPLQREEVADKSSDGEQGKDDSGSEASVGSTVTKTSHYSSNYPLPVILISRSAFKAFQTDFYGYPKHLLLSTTRQTRWVGHGRPHLVTTNPAQQSLYYRQWSEPKPKNVATSSEQNSGTVIETRSASGIVISPDIPDVIEEDSMPATETVSDSSTGAPEAEKKMNDEPSVEGKTVSSFRSDADIETKKVTAKKSWQPSRQAMLSQKSVGTSATSSDSDTEMVAAMDDKTVARECCVKYHRRALLFSGPPQVGKTGAYLHFTRLLQRMLLKLQNVDVYDESTWMPSDTTAAKMFVQAGAKTLWPKFDELAKLPFSVEMTEDRYCNASRVRLPVKKFDVKADSDKEVPTRKITEKRSSKRSLASVILGPHASFDTYHHCDSCKHYRDGMGPSAALCYPYRLKNDQVLQFVIPPTCEAQFIFTEDGQLQGLRLARVLKGGPDGSVKLLKTENSKKEDLGVKTPILTPSTGRHEVGLLNLYHAMDGQSHVHLVFVKQCEVPYYHKAWPNHVIVGLPGSCDREGLGAARYYIKEFATENYLAERKRHGIAGKLGEDVWPLILMMDDSCVMWQNLLQGSMKPNEQEESDTNSKNRYTPLPRVLEDIECIPNLLSFGLLGLRQYSSKCTAPLQKASFARSILNSFILLNVSLLQDVQYDSSRYAYEDIDFSLRVESLGIVTCRLNHYLLLKKFIPTGGKTVFRLQQASGTDDSAQAPKLVEPSEYSKLVNAPDREDTHFFSVPAHYLLELYLANAGSGRLFPTSAGKPNNPVLVIDCYVNLGAKITVEYVSSRLADDERKSRSKTAEKPTTKYSGLLLFFCEQKVTAQFLQQFQFTSGARLCLVCKDRNKLRQEVVRLDLEECWRFRLRDEFQTANNPDEPSLFLLTGKHDK